MLFLFPPFCFGCTVEKEKIKKNHGQQCSEFRKNLRRLPFSPRCLGSSDAKITLSIPTKKTDDDDDVDDVKQPKLAAEFDALKKQVAQLNAQVKELTAVVDGLQNSVGNLEWE